MNCKLEYLPKKGQQIIHGVGTFGATKINRDAMTHYHADCAKAHVQKKTPPKVPKPKRITILPCSETIARQFLKDERFKVHGLVSTPPQTSTLPQKNEAVKNGGQSLDQNNKKKGGK